MKKISLAAVLPFFLPYPTIDTNRWFISDGWVDGDHMSCEWRASAIKPHGNALVFTLSDRGGDVRPYGCGEMHSAATYGYGTYRARIRTASGSGLNTAFFTYIGPGLQSPHWDEIDFEFLGKNPHSVQLHYYVEGKSQAEVLIPLPYDASKEAHDYSFDWEPDSIRWYADGKLIHETKNSVAIPNHAGHIYLSLWSGAKMEDNWLGPFSYTTPVTAEFSSVSYTASP